MASERVRPFPGSAGLACLFTIRPDYGRMIFTPIVYRAMRACEDDIAVPYASLAPFLSDEGTARIDRLKR